jgi:DNA-directed RNA polymerase specialized sigma subunit
LNIFNRSRQTEELDNTLEFSYEQEFENLNREILSEIFLLAENYSDPRARKILELRFNSQKPMPWKKIAANLGLNTNTVINIHKKFLSAAKRDLKKYEIDS